MKKRSAVQAERGTGVLDSPSALRHLCCCRANSLCESHQRSLIEGLTALAATRTPHQDQLDKACLVVKRAWRSSDYRGSALIAPAKEWTGGTFRELLRDMLIEMAFNHILDSDITEAELALYLDDLRGRQSVPLATMSFELYAAERPENAGRPLHIDAMRLVCEVHPLETVTLDVLDALLGRAPIDAQSEPPKVVDDAGIPLPAGLGQSAPLISQTIAA